MQEPYLSEIHNYIRQRRENIAFFTTTSAVRAELARELAGNMKVGDLYPKSSVLKDDEEYLLILRDMFNLSNVLDDMEFTGEGCKGVCVTVWVCLGACVGVGVGLRLII